MFELNVIAAIDVNFVGFFGDNKLDSEVCASWEREVRGTSFLVFPAPLIGISDHLVFIIPWIEMEANVIFADFSILEVYMKSVESQKENDLRTFSIVAGVNETKTGT